MGEDFNFEAAPAAPTLSFGAEEPAAAAAAQEAPKAETAKDNGNLAMEAQLSAEELKHSTSSASSRTDDSVRSGLAYCVRGRRRGPAPGRQGLFHPRRPAGGNGPG